MRIPALHQTLPATVALPATLTLDGTFGLPTVQRPSPKNRSHAGPRLPRALRRWLEGQSPAERLEHQLRDRAARGLAIALGSRDQPYEPVTRFASMASRSPLAALHDSAGVAIQLVTDSLAILDELEMLVELDRTHAVSIDFVLTDWDATSPRFRAELATAARLAEEGLLTRLVLPRSPALAPTYSSLEALFAAAHRAQIHDIVPQPTPQLVADLASGFPTSLLRQLRLTHGMPRAAAGRG